MSIVFHYDNEADPGDDVGEPHHAVTVTLDIDSNMEQLVEQFSLFLQSITFSGEAVRARLNVEV